MSSRCFGGDKRDRTADLLNAGKELLYHTAGYKLLFILHTGLRVGEALALTWADYDDYSKTILIDKNMVYVDGEKITQTPKTESGERVIVLNKQAVMDLQMLRKQFDEQSEVINKRMAEELRQAEVDYAGPEQKSAKRVIKEKYDAIRREHKYICGSSNFPFGSGVSCSTSQGHRKICKKIGLTHTVTVHGLRHPYVKHTTKIFSLRLMDFQAQAYPDARRKTRGACQLLRVGQSRSPVRPLCNRKRFSCLPPQSKMSWILYAISMRLSGYTSTRSISNSASSVVSVSASKIALDASLRLSCRACSSCFCFACANTAA